MNNITPGQIFTTTITMVVGNTDDPIPPASASLIWRADTYGASNTYPLGWSIVPVSYVDSISTDFNTIRYPIRTYTLTLLYPANEKTDGRVNIRFYLVDKLQNKTYGFYDYSFDIVNIQTDSTLLGYTNSIFNQPAIFTFPTVVARPGNFLPQIPINWPCITTDCAPGKLIQEAPLVPGQFQNDAGFQIIGYAQIFREQLPNFFASGKCSTLSRVLRVIGKQADSLLEGITQVVNSGLFNPLLNEKWLFYQCSTPLQFLNRNAYFSKVEFFDPNLLSWVGLYKTSTALELEQSAGPCYFVDNITNVTTFANLERYVYQSYGTLSGSVYYHTLNNYIDDKTIYYTTPGYEKLRKERWYKLEPEDSGFKNKTIISTYQSLFISTALTPPGSGFLTRWTQDLNKVTKIANVYQRDNSWDTLAGLKGLSRKFLETNTNLQMRIYSAARFSNTNSKNLSSINISRLLNNTIFREWDGVSIVDIGSLYPDYTEIVCSIDQRNYIYETLTPVSGSLNKFTSSRRVWEKGYLLYVNGSFYTKKTSQDSYGIINFPEYINGVVTAKYTVLNYEINFGKLSPTANLPRGKYYIGISRNIEVNSLYSIKDSRLFQNGKPTVLGLKVIESLNKLRPIGYDISKWGTPSGRFFKKQESAPLSFLIPLEFED